MPLLPVRMLDNRDPSYPSGLKDLKDFPEKLYIRGTASLEIFNNCVSVVGSRKITPYGSYVTEKLVAEMVSSGLTVVSGFMHGVDITAHKAALKSGGKTIAILAGGINFITPTYYKNVYVEVQNNGLILSEYPESIRPQKWSFPRRNRLVAAISKALVVVEADEHSGTIITARLAKELKRKVFAVPGNITSSNIKGIVSILNDGASCIYNARNVVNYLHGKRQRNLNFDLDYVSNDSNISKNEIVLLKIIDQDQMSLDDIYHRYIVNHLNPNGDLLDYADFIKLVSDMVLKGILVENLGRYCVS